MTTRIIKHTISHLTVNSLVSWMNHFLDNYNTETRCHIIKSDDHVMVSKMISQIATDQKTSISAIIRLISNLNPQDYIYYDYEGNNIATFSTKDEIFEYFDIDNFITDLEYMSDEEIFDWMMCGNQDSKDNSNIEEEARQFATEYLSAMKDDETITFSKNILSRLIIDVYKEAKS